jgi:hypothetical protein
MWTTPLTSPPRTWPPAPSRSRGWRLITSPTEEFIARPAGVCTANPPTSTPRDPTGYCPNEGLTSRPSQKLRNGWGVLNASYIWWVVLYCTVPTCERHTGYLYSTEKALLCLFRLDRKSKSDVSKKDLWHRHFQPVWCRITWDICRCCSR